MREEAFLHQPLKKGLIERPCCGRPSTGPTGPPEEAQHERLVWRARLSSLWFPFLDLHQAKPGMGTSVCPCNATGAIDASLPSPPSLEPTRQPQREFALSL